MEIPTGPELTRAIAASDAALFSLVFDRCDLEALGRMLAPDVEMYHDKDGFVLHGAAEFVADQRKTCAGWTEPGAWRSRRALVAGSLRVYPVPGYGAIEEGKHLFYERQGNGLEKPAGRGRFAYVWKFGPSGWQLARILSFAHEAVESPAPR
jgi:hypothetical protein